MHIQKIAAFSDGNQGGNPAGVLILDQFPSDTEMQAIAAQVGFSETVFAVTVVRARRCYDRHVGLWTKFTGQGILLPISRLYSHSNRTENEEMGRTGTRHPRG